MCVCMCVYNRVCVCVCVCVCVYVCVVYQVDGEEATPENIVSLLIGLGLVCSVRVQRLGLRLGFRVYGLWLRLSDLRVRV